MSEQGRETLYPQCPGCHTEIPQIQWNVQGPVGVTDKGPPSLLIAFFCPACLVVINCQLLPMMPMAPQRPPVIVPGDRFRS